jgi:hypothetical protein
MGIISDFSRKFLPQSIEDQIKPAITIGDQLLGGLSANQGQATAVAAPAQSRQQAVETPTSGSVQIQPQMAYTSFIPQIVSRAPQIARGARDIAIGVGASQFLQGDGSGMGIFNVKVNDKGTLTGLSRKEQRQAKQLVELVGFDEAASMIGVNQQVMAMILLKKFGRGGQGISAAQLRNAQRVNNRIVHMHKTLEQSFKKSTTTARRRATGTRVTQIKN